MFLTSFAIALPETAIPDILANVSGIWGDLLPIILLLLGVYLAFWLIRLITDIATPHSKNPKWFENDPTLTEADRVYYRKRAGLDYDDDDDDYDDEY